MSLISDNLREVLRREGWLKVATPMLEREGFSVPDELTLESIGYAFGEKLAQQVLEEEAILRGLFALRHRQR